MTGLRNLPNLDGLERLGLVDAQRLERIGPASTLVSKAKHITVVDHHVDGETDIENVQDYVVDRVGSVTTLIVEKLRAAKMEVSAPEATLLALGIHADTGNLCFDSTTPRDATALAWAMRAGASQSAIAEHSHATLSGEQQLVLTQALSQINTTIVAGTSVSTVLLRAEGFVNGLAAVTKDVLDLSSSDVLIMAVVYDTKGKTIGKKRGKKSKNQTERESSLKNVAAQEFVDVKPIKEGWNNWKMGQQAERLNDLRASFRIRDVDGSGYLETNELSGALKSGGVLASDALVSGIMKDMDVNSDGKVSFEEFVEFAERVAKLSEEENSKANMILIGRAKAGFHLKSINLAKIFEKDFGGGGHPKAASATCKLSDFAQGKKVLQETLDRLLEDAGIQQPRVAEFMTSPVLMVNQNCVEKDVEEIFKRSDVRALPVVDDGEELVGLVTYKELSAAQARLNNKRKKWNQRSC